MTSPGTILPLRFQTARLLLRPIAAQDAGAIYDSYASDREVSRYLTWRPHRDRDETDGYIARCLAAAPDVVRTYLMMDSETGALRRAFDLRRIGAHRMEFGYVLARPWWGQGLMTEALVEVVTWALRQPAVFRIGAVCDVENIGSARVMAKAGLTREGILRRWLVHPNLGDEPRDCFSYARVR